MLILFFKLNLIWTFVVNGKVIYSELIVLAFLYFFLLFYNAHYREKTESQIPFIVDFKVCYLKTNLCHFIFIYVV